MPEIASPNSNTNRDSTSSKPKKSSRSERTTCTAGAASLKSGWASAKFGGATPRTINSRSCSRSLRRSGQSFLFVGFGISQWYLRVLMKVLVRSLLCNNSAFSGQSVVEFGKEFADVGVFNLDARAALVEQYRPLAVAFRQATQRLGGDAAGSAMQLKAICP